MDLFSESSTSSSLPPEPLASRMRPRTLDEVVGQDRILGEGKLLRRAIEADRVQSIILYGPPGTGKTSIADVIARVTQRHFERVSGVVANVAMLRKLFEKARHYRRHDGQETILFVDEIHRFNKSQQDAFLHYVESGAIVLIGATTENPSFEVIPALLSRCHVFVLEKLNDDDILKILIRAIERSETTAKIEEDGLKAIARASGGDARKALNNLEIVLRNAGSQPLDADAVSKLMTNKALFYDKGGEEHYNLISALHKSLRGSDPQAGLYWLARMLEAGEDPMYVARRLVRFASEDVGLADPNALTQAIAAKDAVHFLGMPEATTALAQLVVYLGTAPKSNALYTGYKQAAKDAARTSHYGAPMHIRNAPTRLMKDLGYGKDYAYSHEFENAYLYQRYFPEEMPEKQYYEPTRFGFEKEIRKRLEWWNKLKEKQLNEKDESDE